MAESLEYSRRIRKQYLKTVPKKHIDFCNVGVVHNFELNEDCGFVNTRVSIERI